MTLSSVFSYDTEVLIAQLKGCLLEYFDWVLNQNQFLFYQQQIKHTTGRTQRKDPEGLLHLWQLRSAVALCLWIDARLSGDVA